MNTDSKELKGILVGCGFMGGMHAQIYRSLPGVSLVAAVDDRVETCTEKLATLGCPAPVYASLSEALAKEPCDFVDICLPTHLHRDAAIEAINAGKALFCEKPLALTLAEADDILTAAEKSGIFAQVGHCIRFWPEYEKLMEFHRSEQGGSLRSLNLVRRGGRPGYGIGNWLNDESQSGGAALDLHIHDADFVLALLGQPDDIQCEVTRDYSGPVHLYSLLRYGEVVVSMEGGWNYPEKWGFQMAFQAVFENAVLDYDSSNGKGLILTKGSDDPTALEVIKPGVGESKSGEGNVSDLGGYYNELKYFTDCLLANTAPKKATLADARASLALALKEIEIGERKNAR